MGTKIARDEYSFKSELRVALRKPAFGGVVDTWLQDVRYGIRLLLKSPGFAAAAMVCLALGIGATTAIFSVVNAVLLRPLPYIQPQRLVKIYSEFTKQSQGRRFWVSPPEYVDLKRDTKSWESLDAWVNGGVNVGGSVEPVRLTGSYISGGLLRSLGVAPIMGRVITPEDDDPKANAVLVISYGVWQTIFGGDSHIVGKEALLNGQKCTIIGVMPQDFAFPPGEIDPPQVWTALQIDPANPGGRGSHYLYLLGRLKGNVSAQQAQSELESLVRYWGASASANQHSFSPQNHTLVSFPFQSEIVSNVRPALVVLMGAVVFVLLIACVNVANLLLARAEARQREIAIRSALGASFWRLLRQFITEGVLLSSVGAVLGLALAFAGLRLIKLTNAGSIPRAAEIGIDGNVLLLALMVSILTGVVFGLAPALHLAVRNIFGLLKDAAGGSTSTLSAQAFRRVLVAAEVSLALVLLIGCGLMLRAFWKLQQVNVGFDPKDLLTLRITLPGSAYRDNLKVESFWSRLKEETSRLPGVKVAIASGLAPIRRPNVNTTDIENFVQKPGGPTQEVDFYQVVSEDYFETMGIPLIEGRYFDGHDTEGSQPVAIVNQTMARMYWPNQSPVGRHIRSSSRFPYSTIIGVVGDVKNAGLDKPTGSELYFPFRQTQGYGSGTSYLVLRSAQSAGLANAVRRELRDLEPAAPVSNVRSMEELISASQSRPRFLTLLLTIFSAVALVLAVVGIYGVLSYLVAQRGKEFGLRMALGAPRGHVLGLVLKQGALLAIAGLGAGLAVSLAMTRMMSTLLYGIRATDPVTFLVMPAALAAAALAASFLPAQRATKVDPMVALRYE
jgi:putative ABC transport system permease protein